MFDIEVDTSLFQEGDYVFVGDDAVVLGSETHVLRTPYRRVKRTSVSDVLHAATTALDSRDARVYVARELADTLDRAWTRPGGPLAGGGHFVARNNNLLFQIFRDAPEQLPETFAGATKEVWIMQPSEEWEQPLLDHGYTRGHQQTFRRAGPLTQEDWEFVRSVPHHSGYYTQSKQLLLDPTEMMPPPPIVPSATKSYHRRLADLQARVSYVESFLATLVL